MFLLNIETVAIYITGTGIYLSNLIRSVMHEIVIGQVVNCEYHSSRLSKILHLYMKIAVKYLEQLL